MHLKYIGLLIKYLQEDNDVDLDEILRYYIQFRYSKMCQENKYILARTLISEFNYDIRSEMKSSELLGFKVGVGDICYIDFGNAYITEAGYQHFGIILGYNNSKAIVVPMSSNISMYNQSYCEKNFPNGKKHLYRLPELKGLKRKSVLFLNDIKYINTARIIEVKGKIDPESPLFKDILCRAKTLIYHNL